MASKSPEVRVSTLHGESTKQFSDLKGSPFLPIYYLWSYHYMAGQFHSTPMWLISRQFACREPRCVQWLCLSESDLWTWWTCFTCVSRGKLRKMLFIFLLDPFKGLDVVFWLRQKVMIRSFMDPVWE